MTATRDEKRARAPRILRPKEQATDALGMISGVLTATFERGYGFLSTGRGRSSYFVLLRDVGAQHWIKGQRFMFTPASPKPGTKAPRALNPVAVETSDELV